MSEISMYVMTEAEAHAVTEDIRHNAKSFVEYRTRMVEAVERAKEGQAHIALGYASWTAYLADVLGEEPLRLARGERRDMVELLSNEGMSTRAIAGTVGISKNTVTNDLREVSQIGTPAPTLATREGVIIAEQHHVDARTGEILDSKPITGMDGKTYNRPAPTKPRTAPRRALTDQFFDAVYDMTKQIERVERLTNDDRFNANKEKVAQKHLNDLIQTHDLLQQVIDSLSN